MKNANIGAGLKANHLRYVCEVDVGVAVNICAGTTVWKDVEDHRILLLNDKAQTAKSVYVRLVEEEMNGRRPRALQAVAAGRPIPTHLQRIIFHVRHCRCSCAS